MKVFKIFSTAALAFMMAACSSEDTAQNNSPAQQQGRKVQFTATIAAPNSGAGTRTEYTEVTSGDAAGTINVAWKANDEIALIHNGKKDVVKIETVNEDGSATITGDITVGTDGEKIEVCYPAALWDAEASGAIRNATFVANTTKQDGTLKYIQDNLDVRMGEGTLKLSGDKATLGANVTLDSQIAIWKLTLQDDATPTPAALKASQVTVKVDGTTPVAIASTTTLGTATSTIYLGLDEITNETLTIEATVGGDTYIYKKAGVTLEYGKYYQSTVTMAPAVFDLSTLTGAYVAKSGQTLTGTTDQAISIEAGATVTLNGVTINATADYQAGITCLGDATIILADGSTNSVTGNFAPGVAIGGEGTTLTIDAETAGDGQLTAQGGNSSAGIGAKYNSTGGAITINGGTVNATGSSSAAGIGTSGNGTKCGAITINGGKVTAQGGDSAAGIGTGYAGSAGNECGAITINGGTVNATGGELAAGIGTGHAANGANTCGAITITADVTSVTATKGTNSFYNNSIGKGDKDPDGTQVCGTITIGGVETGNIPATEYLYPGPFANVTTADLGKVIGADCKIYADAAAATAAHTDAVALIVYVGNTGEAAYNHGLALALKDASDATDWDYRTGTMTCCLGTQYADAAAAKGDMDGMANTATLVGHDGSEHWHPAAEFATKFKYKDGVDEGAHPSATSDWFLPSAGQWDKMIVKETGGYGFPGLITTSGGYMGLAAAKYWLSTECDSNNAWTYSTDQEKSFVTASKSNFHHVRSCLAF